MAETQQFVVLQTTSRLLDHPARELWKRHRAAVLRGFCLIAAGSLAFNTFFIFMPNNLISRHGAGLSPTLLVTAAALAVAAVAALALGRVSDRVGRRPVAIGSCAALVVLAMPATVLATRGSLLGLVLAQVLIGIAVAGVLSVAMLGEAFPAPVRSTGVALTAGIATALIGGTAPWIAQILVRVTACRGGPGRLRGRGRWLGPRGALEMARDRLPEPGLDSRDGQSRLRVARCLCWDDLSAIQIS